MESPNHNYLLLLLIAALVYHAFSLIAKKLQIPATAVGISILLAFGYFIHYNNIAGYIPPLYVLSVVSLTFISVHKTQKHPRQKHANRLSMIAP